jgi:hypothetical protein
MNLPQARTALESLGFVVTAGGNVLYKSTVIGWLSANDPVCLVPTNSTSETTLTDANLKETVKTAVEARFWVVRVPYDDILEIRLKLSDMK